MATPAVITSLTLFLSISHALNLKHACQEARVSCVILLDESASVPEWPPIVTDSKDDPIMPNGTYVAEDRSISVAEGDIINLACSETSFESFSSITAEARCIGGDQFSLSTPGNPDFGSFSFAQLGCVREPDSEVRKTAITCGPGNAGLDLIVGFESNADDGGIETCFRVCFNEQESRTYYAYHTLYENIVGRDHGNDRPSFKPEGLYPFDVNKYYTQAQQLITISELVGDEALGNQYVRPEEDVYLARGHFSPNADFIYYSWQDASFYFINVGPQWQVFNGQNWYYLEDGVRDFVEDKKVNLEVYTGTHGVLELLDINNNPVEIWLYPQDNRLPVPKFFWKVLVDTVARAGVAFVGVNNPHMDPAEIDSYKMCNTLSSHPILDNIYYPDDIERGVTYGCQVNDIASVFPEIPDFGPLDLLE